MVCTTSLEMIKERMCPMEMCVYFVVFGLNNKMLLWDLFFVLNVFPWMYILFFSMLGIPSMSIWQVFVFWFQLCDMEVLIVALILPTLLLAKMCMDMAMEFLRCVDYYLNYQCYFFLFNIFIFIISTNQCIWNPYAYWTWNYCSLCYGRWSQLGNIWCTMWGWSSCS